LIRLQESQTIARKPTAPPTPPAPTATLSGDVPVKPVRKRAAPKPVGSVPATPGTPRKKAAAAGPKKEVERERERAAPNRLDQLQGLILSSLDEDKAENVVALDLAGRASFADRMVIATGLADRQISAMATHLEDKLEEAGLKRIQIEGASTDWVLIDAGDIVIHLFKADAREMYGLERMWGPELDEAAPDDAASGEAVDTEAG
jgi:ribosome silencing factor RsfS/YbeB/iojap